MNCIKKIADYAASSPSDSRLEKISAGILLVYLTVYFLVPYKPWGSPISLHTPILGVGLIVYFLRVRQDIRRGNFTFPPDLVLFALAAGFFYISSCIIHFGEFSRAGVQAYTVSFLCLLFTRIASKKLNFAVLMFWMKLYLIASSTLILLQVNFSGFDVAGCLGQLNSVKGASGSGFASSHIFAGGAIAWMLSIVLARYAAAYKERLSVSAELFYLCAIGCGATGLFYTLNRGAWLAMALTILTISGIFIYGGLRQKCLLKGFAVLCAFVAVFAFFAHPDVSRMREKLSFIGSVVKEPGRSVLNDASSLTRLTASVFALNLIKSHLYWGVGVRQYPRFYERAFPDLYKGLAEGRFDPTTMQTASNSYLYYAVEAGLLPAAFLFAFIAFVLIKGFQRGTVSEAFPIFIGGIAVCLWVMTCDYIGERIFWIAIGLVAGFNDRCKLPGAYAGKDAEI